MLEKNEEKGSTLEKHKLYLTDKIMQGDKKICDELNLIYRKHKEGTVYLQCWCAPDPCHGEIIKQIVESID